MRFGGTRTPHAFCDIQSDPLPVEERGAVLDLRTLRPYLFRCRLIDNMDSVPRLTQPECNGQARDAYRIIWMSAGD